MALSETVGNGFQALMEASVEKKIKISFEDKTSLSCDEFMFRIEEVSALVLGLFWTF